MKESRDHTKIIHLLAVVVEEFSIFASVGVLQTHQLEDQRTSCDNASSSG